MLLVVGAVTYGVPRILRPDLYPGEAFLPGLWHDLDRAFLHLDFGCAGFCRAARRSTTCGWRGWRRTWDAPWDWFRQLLVPWIVLAAPLSLLGTFSFVGVSAPLIITNMVLVERMLSVPGFFKYAWRAAGHANPGRDPVPDFPLLCALGLWATVLLIAMGLFADGIVARFDPRVRTSPARAW